jgi:S1-C subfamily serine protease
MVSRCSTNSGVVSVYSEKMVNLKEPGFGFPFGNNFFQRFFGQQMPQNPGGQGYQVPERGMGSGMILDKEGRILTNFHVVRDVDDVKVQLPDGRRFEAEVVGTDAKTDVAIIRIKGDVPSGLVQRGDVVVEANRKPVASAQQFQQALSNAGNRKNLLLRILRQNGSLFVVVPMEEK